jgi:NTE family protein
LIAFVLSGGGNRGPLEAGALRALLERGVTPDFLVGTSAGAINACFVAAHGYAATTLDALGERWRAVTKQAVYPGGALSIAVRVLRGKSSLFSGDGLRRLIEQSLPPDVSTFGDLRMPLFVTAADLRTSRLFVFGEDPAVPLVDAVLASASVPVIHPPVEFHGLQLVDGGVLANVAASYAMDRGAKEIYVINVGRGEEQKPAAQGVAGVAMNAINTMTVQSLLRDLARARQDETIDLHHIHIRAYAEASFSDFTKSDEMLEAGYQSALAYLDSPRPEWDEPDIKREAQHPVQAPGVRELVIPYP